MLTSSSMMIASVNMCRLYVDVNLSTIEMKKKNSFFFETAMVY